MNEDSGPFITLLNDIGAAEQKALGPEIYQAFEMSREQGGEKSMNVHLELDLKVPVWLWELYAADNAQVRSTGHDELSSDDERVGAVIVALLRGLEVQEYSDDDAA
jgi:hypothetical protein